MENDTSGLQSSLMSEHEITTLDIPSYQYVSFVGNSAEISSQSESTYDKIEVMFWMGVVLYLGLGILAFIGNGLVLYTSLGDLNMGPLRHLDNVIKSLAVADMLYGIIGVPCKVAADYYVGKCNHFCMKGIQNGQLVSKNIF